MATQSSGRSNGGTKNLRPFQKGQSGNPGGRKKIPDDIKEMLNAATPDAYKLLCETINNEKEKTELRVRCAEIVLDRVYGKPKQSVDVVADVGEETRDALRGMGLKERIDAVQAALEAYESTNTK